MEEYKKAVESVVNFWIEKSFNTPMNQDNGESISSNNGIGMFLNNFLSMKSQVGITDKQKNKFSKHLTKHLMDNKDVRHLRDLSVDYDPCKALEEAANYAEIDASCFPCKTWTSIDEENEAIASYQYRGKIQKLN